MVPLEIIGWPKETGVVPKQYMCGHCGNVVGPKQGWTAEVKGTGADGKSAQRMESLLYICSYCRCPSFFWKDKQFPGVPYGEDVEHLPEEIGQLYDEARSCMAVSAYTPAVLACRKILMHVAVEEGADKGQSFKEYVDYLRDEHHIPPRSHGWVDHIRDKGNELNHEIKLVDREGAEELISFLEMLLMILYDYPERANPAGGGKKGP